MTDLPSARESVLDQAYLRLGESRSDTRMDIGVIIHLEGEAPSLADVYAVVENGLESMPVLTHRLRGRPRRAKWERDPAFRLDRHIEEVAATTPGRRGLDEAAERVLKPPLPLGTPWQLWLVTSPSRTRYALCYRVHHAWQDGVGMAQMFVRLLSGGGSGQRPEVPRPARRPVRAIRGAAMAARVVGEIMRPVLKDPVSGWCLSGERRTTSASAPMEQLRAIAERYGGTVHDVHLAALAGAIRKWFLQNDRPAVPVVVTVPVNLREPRDRPSWGNYCMVRRVRLHCDEPQPLARLSRTVAATKEFKSVEDRQSFRDLVFILPAPVVRMVARCLGSRRYAPLLASYVSFGDAGLTDAMGVRDIVPVMLLLPHQPFSVCLVTFGGRAQLAVTSDRAVPQAERLPDLWREALNELSPPFQEEETLPVPDRAQGQ